MLVPALYFLLEYLNKLEVSEVVVSEGDGPLLIPAKRVIYGVISIRTNEINLTTLVRIYI